MSQFGWVQQCVAVDAEGACTATELQPPPSPIPPMSAYEGHQLGGAFACVMGLAWCMAKARDLIDF